MSFLGKLTGGGVTWDVRLDDDAGGASGLLPGGTVRGTARLTAQRDVDARAIVAGLIGVAEWKISTSRRDADGRVVPDTTWRTDDIGRIETVLAGPTRIANGQTLEFPFELGLPLSAAPSLESNVLRVRWELEIKVDVGGVDPSANLPVRVLLPASQVAAAGATIGLNALSPRVEGADGGGHVIEISPVPLVAGRPFSGSVETTEALKGARIEIKFVTDVRDTGMQLIGSLTRETISLTRETGESEVRSIWVGELREAGAGAGGRQRYEFAGELPPDTSPTVLLPYGSATAKVDVVVARRFMPDRHLLRDVAIATTEG